MNTLETLKAAKRLLIDAREMRNLAVRAEQNSHNELISEKYGRQSDEIFYRIIEFNKSNAIDEAIARLSDACKQVTR